MTNTKHILQVINTLTEEERETLKTCYLKLAEQGPVKVSLLYIDSQEEPAPSSLSSLAQVYAKKAMCALDQHGKYFGVDKENHWIASGNVESQTRRLASNIKADVIFVGKLFQDKLSSQPVPVQTASSARLSI